MLIEEDLMAAPATPLVLTILSEGENYGYLIIKRLRELSGVQSVWTDAMVYPLLHRLGRLGYLKTEWRTLPEGRRRKFYAITDDGKAALAQRQRRRAPGMRGMSGPWQGTGWLPYESRPRLRLVMNAAVA